MVDISSWSEIVVCADCALVIVNGDSSGIEDAEAHFARMDANTGPFYIHVTGDPDGGYRHETCGACGEYLFTDEWRDALAEPIVQPDA